MNSTIQIIAATKEQKPKLFKLFMDVVKDGEAFMHNESTTFEEWNQFWFGNGVSTFVAIKNGTIVGSYILKPNQPGVGSHVANGGYMVNINHRGKRIGELLGKHSIEEAKQNGYVAIQFNAVVSANKAAIDLWKKLGFEIVGTNPKAFKSKTYGIVDTYTMYRGL